MINHIIPFLVAIIISLIVTPWVIRVAVRFGAMDQPNERKVHVRATPRLGGLAIFLSFFTALVFVLLANDALSVSWIVQREGLILWVSLFLILQLGVWDDMKTLRPLEKFLVQVLVGSLVYAAGFRLDSLTSPFLSSTIELGIFNYPLTILWIVGITNALNLIDGLDGLASGVAIIASFTLFAISALNHDVVTATISLLLAGALLGFLRYNFNPAQIFLGDSGSLFVGFVLAVLSIQTYRNGGTGFEIAVPALALGLPIVDTALAMVRRFFRSFLPNKQSSESLGTIMKSLFLPDRAHIHHRLIARGLSHVHAVLLMYLVSFALGFGAVAIKVSSNHDRSLILMVLGLALLIGISQLRYKEMALLRNGILLRLYLRLYDLQLLRKALVQALIDGVFVIAAFAGAYYLALSLDALPPIGVTFLELGIVILAIQLLVFWLSGLYRGTVHQVGVGDALRNAKSVGLSVVVSGLAMAFLVPFTDSFLRIVLVLDFYFLLSFIIGSRFSFASLKYLFHKDVVVERRVLIYGADDKGVLILQNLLGFDGAKMAPVGFLDENPDLEGKYLNGYPIFGGHWKLHRTLDRTGAHEIVLASDSIKPEVLKRVKEIGRTKGVVIRRFLIHLEDVSAEGRLLREEPAVVTDRRIKSMADQSHSGQS